MIMQSSIKSRAVFFLISLCCFTTCKEAQRETGKNRATRVDKIVLVNVPLVDRCEMGELIRSISSCNPKVIGLNFLFVEEKDNKCDSVLRQSIAESDKIVLMEGFENGTHVESHKKFSQAAFLTGLTGLSQSKDGVTDYYYRLFDFSGKWEVSFPFLIALQYDKERAAELSSKLAPKDYPIVFHHPASSFEIINYDDILNNCSILNNKLVIVGNLEPGEDVFRTRVTQNSTGETSGTVIIANVVLDILKELDGK